MYYIHAHYDLLPFPLQVYLDYVLGKSVNLIDKAAIEAVQNDVALAVTKIIMKEINVALKGYSADSILKHLLIKN